MNILQKRGNILREDAKEGISAFIEKDLQTGKKNKNKKH